MIPLDTLMASWAREAADIANGFYRRTGDLDFKQGREAVTEADRRIEEMLRERIAAEFPDDAVVGEEGGGDPGAATTVWHLDPIDGTLNFALGLPGFCTSIARVEGDIVTAACIHEPVSGDCYTALRGGGARRNGELVTVSDRAPVGEAIISAQLRKRGRFGRDPRLLHDLVQEAFKLRKVGAVALELAWVAAGSYDGLVAGAVDAIHLYDVAAGWLLVEEAGGVVSGADGAPFTAGSADLIASNGRIHDELVALAGRYD